MSTLEIRRSGSQKCSAGGTAANSCCKYRHEVSTSRTRPPHFDSASHESHSGLLQPADAVDLEVAVTSYRVVCIPLACSVCDLAELTGVTCSSTACKKGAPNRNHIRRRLRLPWTCACRQGYGSASVNDLSSIRLVQAPTAYTFSRYPWRKARPAYGRWTLLSVRGSRTDRCAGGLRPSREQAEPGSQRKRSAGAGDSRRDPGEQGSGSVAKWAAPLYA